MLVGIFSNESNVRRILTAGTLPVPLQFAAMIGEFPSALSAGTEYRYKCQGTVYYKLCVLIIWKGNAEK